MLLSNYQKMEVSFMIILFLFDPMLSCFDHEKKRKRSVSHIISDFVFVKNLARIYNQVRIPVCK